MFRRRKCGREVENSLKKFKIPGVLEETIRKADAETFFGITVKIAPKTAPNTTTLHSAAEQIVEEISQETQYKR